MVKMGRPKSDNPKNKRINLRLTQEEFDTILYVAESLNLTMSEAIIATMEERADEIFKARKRWQAKKESMFGYLWISTDIFDVPRNIFDISTNIFNMSRNIFDTSTDISRYSGVLGSP